MSQAPTRTLVLVARTLTLATLVSAGAASAAAQVPPPDPPPAPTAAPAQTELNVINLPTTRSLERHRSYFRLTHRFARDLRRGSFGSLAEDLFSLDSGAIIGLEYRFGITDHLQAAVHRSLLSKTIQVSGRYDGWRQGDTLPVSISLIGSVEGLDNMTESHQPAVGAAISRAVGPQLVLYAMPAFVGRTQAADFVTGHDHEHAVGTAGGHSEHRHTMLLGLGGRARLLPTVYVSGEYSPRLAGHDPGRGTWGVALEKKTGGHTMQINFTNSFGTTFGQLARGGSEHDVYLGFNITRLF